MTLDEVVGQIEAEGFQWVVCKESAGGYTAHVTERADLYIADTLASGLGCEEGSTAAAALYAAFAKELGYREKRRADV